MEIKEVFKKEKDLIEKEIEVKSIKIEKLCEEIINQYDGIYKQRLI